MEYEEKNNDSESKNSSDKDGSSNNKQLLRKYIHEIKNSKALSREMLHDINNFSYEDRMEILVAYNRMIDYYSNLFENS